MWQPVYASLAEMRDWLRINDPGNTDDDALLQQKLSASSRAVDGSVGNGRQFGRVDELTTFSYSVRWSRHWDAYVADIDDIIDTTGLTFTLDGTELTADQWKLRPRNAAAKGKPYTYVLIGATVTGDGDLDGLGWWGWGTTWPDEVKEATMLQASRLNIRRDSPFGIAGPTGSGTELRLLSRLDPDVAPLIGHLVHPGWVAK